nr:hypothetical protein [Pseudomonadota bacterium]
LGQGAADAAVQMFLGRRLSPRQRQRLGNPETLIALPAVRQFAEAVTGDPDSFDRALADWAIKGLENIESGYSPFDGPDFERFQAESHQAEEATRLENLALLQMDLEQARLGNQRWEGQAGPGQGFRITRIPAP